MIRNYKTFLESNQSNQWDGPNIYDFANSLKGWGHYPSITELKKYSDRFIGEGIYERVVKLVDDIFDSFSNVDMSWVRVCLDDVFDEYLEFDCRVELAVLGKDASTYYSNSVYRNEYNSAIIMGDDYRKSKKRIICDILLDMINPTLRTPGTKSKILRTTDEQLIVSHPKWNCVNFDIDDYITDDSLKHYKSRQKYNIEDFFDCYKPGIWINIKSHSYSKLINLKELEDLLDKAFYRLLKTIDYQKVFYEIPKEGRRINPSETNMMDYTIKILLK